jgi:hypothetical protein
MKKTFLAAILAAASFAAAADVTGFVSYDYDRQFNQGQKPWFSQHESVVGGVLNTKVGAFDGGLVVRQLVTSKRDDALGFEVGYTTLSMALGPVSVSARVGAGRVNQVDVGGGGFTGNASYYSVGAEATMPVAHNITAFAGFRHRNGINDGGPAASNRVTVGTDLEFTKSVSLRVGYAQTWQNGTTLNGVTSAVSYKF